MRKLMKLMTITTIASISTFQVVACKDNSQYDSFLKEVDDSQRYSFAFFGFLGSADNEASKDLYDTFDYLNRANDGEKSKWEEWVEGKKNEMKGVNINNIYLHSYQGPAHDPVPSDPIDSFWNDKSITWQRNIFNWVYKGATDSENLEFQEPTGVPGVVKIDPKKDSNDNDMFQELPIVFIVKNGQLITAGQNWVPTDEANTIDQKVKAIQQFILSNLLLPSSEN